LDIGTDKQIIFVYHLNMNKKIKAKAICIRLAEDALNFLDEAASLLGVSLTSATELAARKTYSDLKGILCGK
jgi:hypothetical protein